MKNYLKRLSQCHEIPNRKVFFISYQTQDPKTNYLAWSTNYCQSFYPVDVTLAVEDTNSLQVDHATL